MRIATTLHKSLDEVLDLSVAEIQLWTVYFGIEAEQKRKTQDGGKTANRSRTR